MKTITYRNKQYDAISCEITKENNCHVVLHLIFSMDSEIINDINFKEDNIIVYENDNKLITIKTTKVLRTGLFITMSNNIYYCIFVEGDKIEN